MVFTLVSNLAANYYWTSNVSKTLWTSLTVQSSLKDPSPYLLKALWVVCLIPNFRLSPMNVLPLVNKGLALYQWKQDNAVAETLCREALLIDPDCEAAVATLAQLSLQQGKIDAAVEMFSRHADLARTEPELMNALTYKYVSINRQSSYPADRRGLQASQAQVEFMQNYPTLAGQLGQLARSMM